MNGSLLNTDPPPPEFQNLPTALHGISIRVDMVESHKKLSSAFVWGMVLQVVEFSIGGYKINKIFCLKINIHEGNSRKLRIGVMASCQKLGIILIITWFKKWSYQKKSKAKNVLLNWYHSMKKIGKDSNDFWHRKLTLFDTSPLHQLSKGQKSF